MKAFVLGLTGPTGAGKTTAILAAEKLGFKCIDADKVTKALQEKGSPLLKKLEEEFGKSIILPSGELDRAALSNLAFNSPDDTLRLNKTVLPCVIKKIKNIINDYEQNGEKYILLDAPTLFEAGANTLCDKTVAVTAQKDIRLKRICERDEIDKMAAALRISAGKPDGFYKENCDIILENNGTESEFMKKAYCAFVEIIKGEV